MEQTRQLERYVFRKPLWRRLVPILLLLLVWLPVAFVWRGADIPLQNTPLASAHERTVAFLADRGITLERIVSVTLAITAVLLFLLFWGFEILVVTPEAIIRRLPFGIRRSLRWVDVDEVLIDHLEARFEGDATAKKTLILYSIPKGLLRRRRKLQIGSKSFDNYEDVERIAVQVSVPAVAARLRARIEQDKRPALFPLREPGEVFYAFFLFLVGAAAVFATAINVESNPLWTTRLPYMQYVRLAIAVGGLLAMIAAMSRLFYRQIGVDQENIYILLRKWVRKKISIDTVADIQIRDNQMRIYAYTRDPDYPRQVFRTNRFMRNRGVLLRLIREEYELRRSQDNVLIQTTRAREPIETASQPEPETQTVAD